MSDREPRPTYSQEEVNEILKRALRQQSLRKQTLSHAELVEMAGEVGIDRESLEEATADLAQSRADELARESSTRELAEERSRLFTKFVTSLFTYLVVNALLFFIDRRFTGGTWYFWVLAGWGIGLAFQFRGLFFPEESLRKRKLRELAQAQKLQRRAERAARRRRLHAALEAGNASELMNAGAKEFENAVQAGVAALLTVAARKIQAHAEGQAPRPVPDREPAGRPTRARR